MLEFKLVARYDIEVARTKVIVAIIIRSKGKQACSYGEVYHRKREIISHLKV